MRRHERNRAGKPDGPGLLATQAIRGGANRASSNAIKGTGDVFFAYPDEPWILSGAAVHISFVGQDDGTEGSPTLDGRTVASINSDPDVGVDLTKARRLSENLGIAFIGDTEERPFDIDPRDAQPTARLTESLRPVSNADVVGPG